MIAIYFAVGILLVLAWLYIYLKYFSKTEGKKYFIDLSKKNSKEYEAYFVAPFGDDNNSGSLTSPWGTITYAVSQLGPGEKLLLRGGVYKEYVSINKSGSVDNPIEIGVFQDEEAILDGAGLVWKYGLNFQFGVSYVTLTGLKIKNTKEHGVTLWGENRSIQLRNLEIQGCGTGLHIISATDLLVKDCNLHNNNGPGLVVSPGPVNKGRIVHTRSSFNESPELPDGFKLDSGEDILFEKCFAEYNAGNGFGCLTSSMVISSCVVRHNGRYGIRCVGEDNKLVNCIVDSNGMAGIALLGGGSYELYNNLAINCGSLGDYGLIAGPEADTSIARVALINNIFAYNYGGVHFGCSAVLERENHNIFWSRIDSEISVNNRRYSRDDINERVWFQETGRGERSFSRDPLFVDYMSNDFRLAKNSPAIDRGAKDGSPGTDINGGIRPQGWGIDIGPYESAEGTLIPPTADIIFCPSCSSDDSESQTFKVKWAGSIFIEKGNVTKFHIQYKEGEGGAWQNWLLETSEYEGEFSGSAGRTYCLRVRAKDDLGNWGNWSDSKCAVVPIDDQNPLIKYEGSWSSVSSEHSFLNTLHYSDVPGASASILITGKEFSWISTTGPDRGIAVVYLDDIAQAKIDLYDKEYEYRQRVFTVALDGKSHLVRIEVDGKKNSLASGCRVDIDGIYIKS